MHFDSTTILSPRVDATTVAQNSLSTSSSWIARTRNVEYVHDTIHMVTNDTRWMWALWKTRTTAAHAVPKLALSPTHIQLNQSQHRRYVVWGFFPLFIYLFIWLFAPTLWLFFSFMKKKKVGCVYALELVKKRLFFSRWLFSVCKVCCHACMHAYRNFRLFFCLIY